MEKKALKTRLKIEHATSHRRVTSRSQTHGAQNKKTVGLKPSSVKNKIQKKNTKLIVVEQKEQKKISLKIRNNSKIGSENRGIQSIKKTPLIRPEMRPMIPSPYRFPVPSHQHILAIVKYAAPLFIAVGTLFSLVQATTLYNVNTESNLGSISESLNTEHSDEFTLSESNKGASETQPQPVVKFTDVDTSLINISVTVPHATKIEVLATEHEYATMVPLGTAEKIDETNWSFKWKTKEFLSGNYTITLLITNQYGVYEFDNVTQQVAIKNPNDGVVESTQLLDLASSTVTNESPNEIVTLSSVAHSNSLVHELIVSAKDATEVKLYALNEKARSEFYIGQAEKKDSETWQYDWNMMHMSPSTYLVTAKTRIRDRVFDSNTLEFSLYEQSISQVKNISNPTTTPEEDVKKVEAVLSIPSHSPLHGVAPISIEASDTERIEIYMQPLKSLTQIYIGTALQKTDELWEYSWQTTQSPNGEYEIFARVYTKTSSYDTKKSKIVIRNENVPELTEQQEERFGSLQKVKKMLRIEVDSLQSFSAIHSSTEGNSPAPVYIQSVDEFLNTVTVDVENEDVEFIKNQLDGFRKTLDERIRAFEKATRNEQKEDALKIKGEIENLRSELLKQVSIKLLSSEIIDEINTYISQVSLEKLETVTMNERILKEYIGDILLSDSDSDGLSDYDEMFVYNTNMFSADTDSDGFIDTAELMHGYDPHLSVHEAILEHQSPRDIEDLHDNRLTIVNVAPLTHNGTKHKALITGTGLPNSFVTLYIFSTPIIAHVRTDHIGNWVYIFDKSIESGTHEIIATVTDNSGKIYAKSESFGFTKTNETFNTTDTLQHASVISAQYQDGMSGKLVLLVSALLIVVFGFVLGYVGFHIKRVQNMFNDESTNPQV